MSKSKAVVVEQAAHDRFLNTARRDYSHETVDVPYSDFWKRGLDIAGALVLLAVFALPMLAIYLWVRADGGPAFYRQRRIGRNGYGFWCLKFRTMVPDAEERLRQLLESSPEAMAEWQRDQKLKADPRITGAGRWLRKTSLDELPQLFNVLAGDMSLVGPRPIVRDELSRYGSRARHYLSVKPGLTGLWQVSGRNDLSYTRRVALDVFYVKNGSVLFDLWVLLRTVRIVLNGFGAY